MPLSLDLLFDGIGIAGVGLILLAYFLLQTGKLTARHMRYQWLNIAGSCLLLVSLYWKWNTPSVVIQCSWIAISFYGIYQTRKGAKNAEK